ncbi:hypothetical protein OCEANICA350_12409 [Oceanicaulis sp. 350]|nr:hypothetical protein OCEANICA350_12409 [Oceanicaulis sp. 350]
MFAASLAACAFSALYPDGLAAERFRAPVVALPQHLRRSASVRRSGCCAPPKASMRETLQLP